jgi:hypothetical protein
VTSDPATTNVPEETFYWSADALIDKRTVGVRARLVLAQEAAFLNGPPAAGDQVTFGRIRVRVDGAHPGAEYTVTHPYGTEHLTADSRGRVRMTDDVGCADVPCDFTDALATRVGPFLRWDPDSPPAAPAGYVGNPLREHTVVGSPRGAAFNVFRITGPSIGGPGDNLIETHLFTVEGKAATTQGTASPPAGGTTPPAGGTPTTPPVPGGGTTPPGTPAPPAPPDGAAPAAPAARPGVAEPAGPAVAAAAAEPAVLSDRRSVDARPGGHPGRAAARAHRANGRSRAPNGATGRRQRSYTCVAIVDQSGRKSGTRHVRSGAFQAPDGSTNTEESPP